MQRHLTPFRYEAIGREGLATRGVIKAPNDREALRTLEARGLRVVVLSLATPTTGGLFRGPGKLQSQGIALAMHELATLLSSGVPLMEAVEAQAAASRHPLLHTAFNSMAKALRSGRSFAEALGSSGLPLPPYFLTLAKAGDASGMTGKALHDAVAQMEYEIQVRADIRTALIYPIVLVLAGLIAITVMLAFVVPRFASLLDRADELPLLAWAVLSSGIWIRQWGLGLTAALIIGAVATRHLWWTSARRNALFESAERVPVIGEWWVEAETARWAKILSTLLINRVPLMDALDLAREGVQAPTRRERLGEAARAVRGGQRLADALEDQSVLTPTGYNLVRVGERSGELPAMLSSLSSLCENAGRNRMKHFLALLEPAAIIIIGGFIGVVMIGIILAITSANDLAV